MKCFGEITALPLNLPLKTLILFHIWRNLFVPKGILEGEKEEVREVEFTGTPFHRPASDNNAPFRLVNRVCRLFLPSFEHLVPLTSPCAVTASCIVWRALDNSNTYGCVRGAALRGCENWRATLFLHTQV